MKKLGMWMGRTMAVQCAIASVGCFYCKQWRLGFYWAFATGINVIVSTF